MQYNGMHFPALPPASPFHLPIFQVPPATAQALLQNHVISPSQHTPISPPHLEQQHTFQTQPDSVKHEMDLGADARDQLTPRKISWLKHIIQQHSKQILHNITPSHTIPLHLTLTIHISSNILNAQIISLAMKSSLKQNKQHKSGLIT
eukprot:12590097-Ditylum_brightwellii.AAC.1